MAKFCATSIAANACTYIRDNVTKLVVVKPGLDVTKDANTALSTVAYKIATQAMGAGTCVLGDSSVTGKKLDVPGYNNLSVDSTGEAAGIALVSTVTNLIYWYTTCATQTIQSTSNKINTGAFIIRISDAT